MTVSSPPDPTRDNTRNTELLRAELPAARYVDETYLRWLYDENPYGPAIQRAVDDDGVRVAHYALIPQRYRGRDGVVPAAFSLHAVVRSGTQRKGYFQQIGAEIYEEAAATGWQLSTGVCNDKSIGAVVKYMGWKTPGPLPVKLCVPMHAGRGVTSTLVDDGFRSSREFADVTQRARRLRRSTSGPTRTRPSTCAGGSPVPSTRYALHVERRPRRDHDHRHPLRRARRGRAEGVPARAAAATPVTADAIVGAACRFHRAPYAVYAGFNRRVRVRGVQPPRRLQPSPLHLILRSLSPAVDQDTLAVDTFEFLDMDAY